MPGALLLLAFQAYVGISGAVNHLPPTQQAAFAISLLSVALSALMLGVVIVRRRKPAAGSVESKVLQAHMQMQSLLLLAGLGALGGGLGSDFFVIVTRITGSPGVGGFIGATILAFVCVPWL